MDGPFGSKPMICFEVERVIGVSEHGTYQVQWAPAWVSKLHLVGCEHLIEEFLQQQVEMGNESEYNTQTVSLKPAEPSFDPFNDTIHNERAEPDINSIVSQESTEASHFLTEERNACFDELSYSQEYPEPLTCYDVKPNIHTNINQGSTEQSQSSGKDFIHQFEMLEEPIIDTEVVKSETNESNGEEMSASNDFITSDKPVRTGDCENAINPSILNEMTNLQSVDYANASLGEISEANSRSFLDKMYPENRNLDTNKGSHTTSKMVTCDVCQKSFSSKSRLELHHRIHTGFKPYSCPHCSYSSAQKGTMTLHMTTHSAERPYGCDVCQKTFARSKYLKVHKRTHNNKKPYSCSICGKAFTTSSNLNQHARTHTKERPFQCGTCQKCFSQKSHLKRHIMRTHAG